MVENIKKLLIKVSAWHIFYLCITASILTFFLLYNYGHLGFKVSSSSYELKSYIKTISNDDNAKEIIKQNENLQNLITDLPVIIENLDSAGNKLFDNMFFFRILGIISFLSGITTCFFKPKFLGLISVPIGFVAFLWGSF